MALSEQKRQRKLAKKHAKDSQRRKKIVLQQQQMSSLAGKMTSAAHGKILRAGISESIQTVGKGNVTIVRQGPDGLLALAMFLVDSYCLGVKDTAGHLLAPVEINDILENFEDRGMVNVSPGVARSLVEGAVAYARQFGIEPHPDYRKVACIFGDIELESIEGLYTFGRDGRPCYSSGPFDDLSKQSMILNKLDESVGRGNYDFLFMSGDLSDLLTASSDEEIETTEDWRQRSIDGEVHRIDY